MTSRTRRTRTPAGPPRPSMARSQGWASRMTESWRGRSPEISRLLKKPRPRAPRSTKNGARFSAPCQWRPGLGRRSRYRHGLFLDFEADRDLMQPPMHWHDPVQLRVEIVLQHHGPRVLQIEVGVVADIGGGHHVQLVTQRDMLHDARYVRDSQLPERIGPMA